MRARSRWTGLFDMERTMQRIHRFKKGAVVTVFQMHPRRGLEIEGKATVLHTIPDVDEQYMVRFHGRDDKPSLGEEYERFVDAEGQTNPKAYVQEFNAKIGYS